MRTLIENVSLFLGSEFQVIKDGSIQIDDGEITFAGEGKPPGSSQGSKAFLDGHGLLAIPGLIDAHTHLADSIAKDIGIGSRLDELVHPLHGLKIDLLKEAPETQICEAMAATASDMLASGITTFADFREGGLAGVQLAEKALCQTKARAVVLGRPNYYFNERQVVDNTKPLTRDTFRELAQTLEICGGLGISGANEYTDSAMEEISELAKSRGKLLGVHAAESEESMKFSLEKFSSTEVERVLHNLKPNFLVHLTNSTAEDREKVSEIGISVVCCPRANSILGLGFPPMFELVEAGVNVALGTDNVMLNSPDMFREMDFASRIMRANQRRAEAIGSKEILKMATLNAARVLGLESEIGSIEEGKRADIAFLALNSVNLRFSRDLVASVVHRARREDVECVFVNGEVVHGSISAC
jgi:cytosine/adenosine deaminase-related metal-dependent hydrolase